MKDSEPLLRNLPGHLPFAFLPFPTFPISILIRGEARRNTFYFLFLRTNSSFYGLYFKEIPTIRYIRLDPLSLLRDKNYK